MKSDAQRPTALPALAVVLFLLAVGCVAAGFAAMHSSLTSSEPSFEIGKWLLQLATVLTGAGFLAALLRQIEATRAERQAWLTILQDLVVSQDAIESSCLRLISNANAQTYTELIEKCREMRATLRRIIALPEAYEYSADLRRHVQQMRHYLKPLIHEYERHYFRVTRQNMLDEKVFEAKLEKLAKNSRPTLADDLLKPAGVGTLIRDAQQFPSLAACMRDFDEREGQFKEESELDSAYESVKLVLRKNAGLGRRR